MTFFTEKKKKAIFKFFGNHKSPQISKVNLRETKPDDYIRHPDCYQAVEIKTMWYKYKNIHTKQWNRIYSPEIVHCT